MNFTIAINQQTCIRCGRCVRICPAHIFTMGDKTVQVIHPENCIKCGHCVGVCPTDAVIHSVFPPETVHPIERSNLPSAEQLMLLIKARRSNRAMTKAAVPDEFLDLIVEAAHRAPTASNAQTVAFTIVTDPEKIRQIVEITADVLRAKVSKILNPVIGGVIKRLSPKLYTLAMRINSIVASARSGKDPILRGAGTVLFIHAPEGSNFGNADCNLAYQNASIMAESLGVSQFYTGFVCRAIADDKHSRINKLLGIDGVIHAGMGLGMPSFQFEKYIDKEPVKVRKV